MIRFQLAKQLQTALKDLGPQVQNASVTISEPGSGIDADLCSNAALVLAGKLGMRPSDLAAKIAEGLKQNSFAKNIETTANGYLNFKLSDSFLQQIVFDIVQGKQNWFCPDLSKKVPKTLIEFVSANPTGPLHIGHGRGAALGDSLARIYRYCKVDVQTEYYINDVGVQMQILADSVRARSQESDGAQTPFLENGYKGEYVKEIATLMKKSDRTDFDFFPKNYILEWIKKDLEAFNIHFDSWFSESTLVQESHLQNTLDLLNKKGVLKQEDGALWFVGAEKHTGRSKDKEAKTSSQKEQENQEAQDRVLRKSDGRTTYYASDIAYHHIKASRGYKKCIDIWGHDHHGYVPRMQSAMAALDLSAEFLQVLLYQLVSLKRDGKKVAMSTRSGEFVTLRDILDEVGADACRFFFAMRSPNSQLEFDVDLAKKQSNENPVFYVQYVHARICSIFNQAKQRGISCDFSLTQDKDLQLEPQERDLIIKIASLGDVLDGCMTVSSPHLVANYLMDCAMKFHKFYDSCRVLDATGNTRAFRFALLESTRKAVELGLNLLGVNAPEKM